MTTAQVIVTMLGLCGIVWVNYYFFWAGRGTGEGIDRAHGHSHEH